MITSWRIQNMKAFRDTGDLRFAPLTLFVGANSSGKSTVLQSILAVAQTVSERFEYPALALNGKHVRLGGFAEVLHSSRLSDNLEVSYSTRQSLVRSSSRWDGRPSATSPTYFVEHMRASFLADSGLAAGHRLEELELTLGMHSDRDSEPQRNFEIAIRRRDKPGQALDVPPEDLESYAEALEYEVLQFSSSAEFVSFAGRNDPQQPVGVGLRSFVPSRALFRFDLAAQQVDVLPWYFNIALVQHKRDFLPPLPLDPALSERLAAKLAAYSPVAASCLKDITDLRAWYQRHSKGCATAVKSDIRKALQDWSAVAAQRKQYRLREMDLGHGLHLPRTIGGAFRNLQYLGPLRAQPAVLYAWPSSTEMAEIGQSGEFTAAVFQRHAESQINYYPPESNESVQATLREAVIRWMEYFGLACDMISEQFGRAGAGIGVAPAPGGPTRDLTAVGVGVSQVLPVLILALQSEPGSTLIFEQPELHLHPAVQANLADFLLSIVRLGKQCIVETHSEHLINRLRRRKAEAATEADEGAFDRSVALHFVERTGESSEVREIAINRYGAIPDWPVGFFDDGPLESDAIADAAFHKHRTVHGEGNLHG